MFSFLRFQSIFREYALIPLSQYFLAIRFYLWKYPGSRRGDVDSPRILVLCQVKNEVDIIDDWLRYHLYIFGRKNIVVMDDGSDDGTIEVLEMYGDDIVFECLAEGHQGIYNKKHNFTRKMKELRHQYDIMVPIDADEFIVCDGAVDRESILRELASLDIWNWGVFKFKDQYVSVSRKESHDRAAIEITDFAHLCPGYDAKKVFFAAKSMESVGLGQHRGYTSNRNQRAYITKLSLYHFCWRGRKQMLMKCIKGAESYSNWWRSDVGGSHYKRGVAAYQKGEFDSFFDECVAGYRDITQRRDLANLLLKLDKTDSFR